MPDALTAGCKGAADLAIVAAVTAELEPLLQGAAFAGWGKGYWRHRQKPVLAAAVGVGLVDFAAGLEALLARHAVRGVVLTGSCGVYPAAARHWPPGSLVAPLEAVWADVQAMSGRGYFPGQLLQRGRLDRKLTAFLQPECGGRALTLATITAEDTAAAELEAFYQAQFEQMELFALVRVCARRHLPAAALLGVTNRVGGESHRQWREYAAPLAVRCGELLKIRLEL